jgi:hypothetical protein
VKAIEAIVSILVLIAGLELRVQKLVKTYLKELVPNSGTSMKDQINRLEERQYQILTKLLEK